MFYDQGNPYDADLRLTLPDGHTSVFVLTPMGLATLMRQLDEVRTAQKHVQHVIDGGDPDDFDVSAAWQPSQVYSNDPPSADDADVNREVNESQQLPQRIVRKAVDPYSFLSLLDMMPPIGGRSGKSVVTMAVLAALVLSAFVGIVLV